MLPTNLKLFHMGPPTCHHREASKSKLNPGSLLSPLVQQVKLVAFSTGRPCALLAKHGWGWGWAGKWQIEGRN